MKKFFTSALLIVFLCEARATIYTVNSTSDASSGSGTTGTLRWCIVQANAGAGKDTINFALTGGGPYTFTVASNYATITNPVYINGYSQATSVQGALGAGTRTMQIVLNGPGNNTVYGFNVTASNCEFSGLVIQDFYVGIFLNGSDNTWIWGCYIGTDNTATSTSAATTNYDDGIRLSSNANNNIIGTNGDGTNDDKEGNCIGGNGDGGSQYLGECISINEGGAIGADCTGNRISGNYLGINQNGTAALYTVVTSNAQRGSGIHMTNSTSITIGTNADGVSDSYERNIISGNSDAGIVLQGSSSVKIKGNYIGTDKTGLLSVPNYSNAGTNIATTQVAIKSTSTNNTLGTDGDGVRDNIEGNVIGSGTITAGSANSYSDGIDITSSSTGNKVSGNYIGIGSNGTTALPILTTGITVNDYAIYLAASGNTIGTNGDGVSDALEANYIGNSGTGVYIESGATNVIAGNYFGLNTSLNAATLGYAGVYIWSGTSNRIGSSASNVLERNYICNSSQMGVWVDGNGSNDNDLNNIRYNFIGLKPDSSKAPNSQMGVYISNKSNADTIQYNLIAFNGTASVTGIYPGIQIGNAVDEAKDNYIYRNTIYKNIGPGISLIKKESKTNRISQNSIYNNGNGSDATGRYRLGIDIENDNVTANDDKDSDDMANAGSNFPVITAAIKGGVACTQAVSGTFNGLGNTQYFIELFSSNVCNGDTSGVDYYTNSTYKYGEGRTYEGSSSTFTTDGNGNANWSLTMSITNSTGMYLTATAIQLNGGQSGMNNTSEFSLCYTIASDLGDAPDTYKTLLANCGPLHANAGSTLKIGTSVTTEDDGQPSAAANLDSDDGVSSFPAVSHTSTTYSLTNIPVTNSTGSTATLYAWIDFNRNNSFEVGEYSSASVASGATTATLTWNLSSFTCESNIKSGISYFRMRLTTDSLADDGGTSSIDERSYGLANNGEVEDYKIYISGNDYGDLSATYPVATAAVLEDTATAKVWTGANKPDTECTQNFSADGMGDGSDEDGLTTWIGPVGGSYNWVINLRANQAGKTVYYGLWIDWDGTGNFTSGLDAFYGGSASVTGSLNQNVSVFTPSGGSNAAFRVMVSDAPITSGMFNATITNGEVEDYTILRVLSAPGNILMGTRLSSGNLLTWKNISGLLVNEYTIEKSIDNISWNVLGNVNAVQGNTFRYNWSDVQPAKENYYRLKFILPDGSYQYSNIVPLFDKNTELPVIMYPNPAIDKITIHTANSNYISLKIVDLMGRVLLKQEINSVNTIVDVTKLAAGTHLVKFTRKDGTEEVQRLVKARN